ncbi:MAG: hypothetical protein ABFQ53_02765 [Patescibacteria group bacterium]
MKIDKFEDIVAWQKSKESTNVISKDYLYYQGIHQNYYQDS